MIEYRLLEPSGPVERTALLTSAAADGLPGHDAPGAGPAEPGIPPAAPSPLEISAEDLFRSVDEAARQDPSSPVVAASALAAVHSSGVTSRPRLDPLPEQAPPSPDALPPPPRRLPDATLSQFPLRREGAPPSGAAAPPVVRVRKPRPSASYESAGRAAAGFFPRLLALLVDSVILLALNLLLLSPVFLVFLFKDAFQSTDLLRDWAFLGILVGCGLMIFGANLWYVVGGWARTGRTPGKALLRLTVVPVGPTTGPGVGLKTAFVRFLAWNLSGLLLGIGFLLVLFRKDRRALHDLVAGTKVVKTP